MFYSCDIQSASWQENSLRTVLDRTPLQLALEEDTFAVNADLPEKKIILCYGQTGQKAEYHITKQVNCEQAYLR